MTRQEFSKIIYEFRKQSGITIKNICLTLNCLSKDSYSLEKGQHSYNLQKCLNYLDAIGAKLVINTSESNFEINSYSEIVDFVIKQRAKQSCSQRALAAMTGCSYVTIAYFETQRNTITIDNLLKIGDALNFSLNIIPK